MRTDFVPGHQPTIAEACEAFTTRGMLARQYQADTRRSYTRALGEYLRRC
jgi:hypothetical protein